MLRWNWAIACVATTAVACSSDDGSSDDGAGGSAAGGAPMVEGRLSPSAVEELEALGVRDYEGVAEVVGEETQGSAVRLTFDPDTGPICMYGGDFHLFYEDRASPDQLLILLDGGGACWTGFCFASETADETIPPHMPMSAPGGGMFGDWDVIFVPYCDGSVYSGDNEVVETDGRTRYHHGRQNLAAALDTAKAQFPDTKEIVLAGFSAGGYGTIPGAIAARLVFPNADLHVVNDSGPGVQNLDATDALQTRLDEWRFADVVPASCTECDGGAGQLTQMIAWTLRNDPTIKVSMLSYLGDNVIGDTFLGLPNAEYEALLLSETKKVHDEFPDRLERFMLPGDDHVLQPTYTTLEVGGVLQKDWIEAMVAGDATVWTDQVEPSP